MYSHLYRRFGCEFEGELGMPLEALLLLRYPRYIEHLDNMNENVTSTKPVPEHESIESLLNYVLVKVKRALATNTALKPNGRHLFATFRRFKPCPPIAMQKQ